MGRGRGGGEIKAGRLGRKGKGSFSLFPLTLFPATPPPPLSLAFILLSRDYEIVFQYKNYCFERGGRSRESGGESEMAPYPLSLSRFSPPPPSVFSPVTQLLKSVSVKLLLRRGGRSRKGVGGREGNGSLCLFAFAFFSILPFSFSICHAASKESQYEN